MVKFATEKNQIASPIISDDRLTIYKPVYDSAGAAQCFVVIEMSLELISDYGRAFTAKVLALFSGCFVFVFVVGLRFVENNIVLPVNAKTILTNCGGWTFTRATR